MFKGNTGDPATLASQVTKLRQRFGLAHVAVVGDRGMLTKARIRDDLKPAELDWITALRGPAIKALIAGGRSSPPCSTRPTWPRSPPRTTPASG